MEDAFLAEARRLVGLTPFERKASLDARRSVRDDPKYSYAVRDYIAWIIEELERLIWEMQKESKNIID
jgi:hypothetical protein